ncbi:unnamed protein product, partial [Hymenolepis diminuta]
MRNHIRHLPGLCTVVLFTILSGLLQFDCGALFSKQCQESSSDRELTILISTACLLFLFTLLFCIVNIFNIHSFVQVCEFITLTTGTSLMIAAVGQLFYGKDMVVPLMASISMAVGFELVIFISVEFLV